MFHFHDISKLTLNSDDQTLEVEVYDYHFQIDFTKKFNDSFDFEKFKKLLIENFNEFVKNVINSNLNIYGNLSNIEAALKEKIKNKQTDDHTTIVIKNSIENLRKEIDAKTSKFIEFYKSLNENDLDEILKQKFRNNYIGDELRRIVEHARVSKILGV